MLAQRMLNKNTPTDLEVNKRKKIDSFRKILAGRLKRKQMTNRNMRE